MLALRSSTLPDLLRRLGTAGLAALVLALTVFVASPTAHEWLHADDHANCHESESTQADEDACAVVLFAGGVSLPLDPVAVLEPVALALTISPATAAEIHLVSPRYLRRPERGPPVS